MKPVFVDLRQLKLFSHLICIIAASFSLTVCQKQPLDPTGNWRGFVKNPSGEQVAFAVEIKRDGSQIAGSLVNGEERTPATGGSIEGNTLKLRFDYYDGEMIVAIDGDEMRGTFERQWRKEKLKRELRATRSVAALASSDSASAGVDISGEWVFSVGEAPKLSRWRAAFKQEGGEVRGTIMPMSGDWGEIAGSFAGDQLSLNRFDGINSRVLKLRLLPQGRLEGYVDMGLFDPKRKLVAERIEAVDKEILANLPDPDKYTRMTNPAEPLRFSFPDLDGKVVSATDDRFKNKVVLVTITGSWCPNCHEEAPLLQEFYERYQAEGFEVVALAFEYTGDTSRDLEQVKIFDKRHNLTYPMLLAGSNEEGEISRKLPQLVNFGAYPTTIFIGRDGLVKRIHSGFEGRATGERFTKLKAEYEAEIKELLAETEN
jgi:thiol-disulfide isomerase/thioredoxin